MKNPSASQLYVLCAVTANPGGMCIVSRSGEALLYCSGHFFHPFIEQKALIGIWRDTSGAKGSSPEAYII